MTNPDTNGAVVQGNNLGNTQTPVEAEHDENGRRTEDLLLIRVASP